MYTQGDMATGAPYQPTTGTAGGPGAHATGDTAGANAAVIAGATAADSAGAGAAGSDGNSSPVFIGSHGGVDGKSLSGERSVGVVMVDSSAASSPASHVCLSVPYICICIHIYTYTYIYIYIHIYIYIYMFILVSWLRH